MIIIVITIISFLIISFFFSRRKSIKIPLSLVLILPPRALTIFYVKKKKKTDFNIALKNNIQGNILIPR